MALPRRCVVLLRLTEAASAAFPRFAANSHAIYGVDGSLETQKGRFNVLPSRRSREQGRYRELIS
jgi:hypothetical protein